MVRNNGLASVPQTVCKEESEMCVSESPLLIGQHYLLSVQRGSIRRWFKITRHPSQCPASHDRGCEVSSDLHPYLIAPPLLTALPQPLVCLGHCRVWVLPLCKPHQILHQDATVSSPLPLKYPLRPCLVACARRLHRRGCFRRRSRLHHHHEREKDYDECGPTAMLHQWHHDLNKPSSEQNPFGFTMVSCLRLTQVGNEEATHHPRGTDLA